MSLNDSELLKLLPDPRSGGTWWLGFSGGLDSSVLLYLLAGLREQNALPPLRAVHINHQMHPDAGRWQASCEAVCRQLDIPLEVRSVEVSPDGHGLEAAARAARYRIFEQCLNPGDSLLLAHHRDDQVETFFLRLMRGAGTRGLAGIPRQRSLAAGRICRPLLAESRAGLESWALQAGISWIEDGSNRDTRLDRNFLRHEVLPLLAGRWPGYRETVTRAMEAVAESESLLLSAYGPVLDDERGVFFGEPTLELACLVDAAPEGAAWLLRRWLLDLGLPLPGRDSLVEFVRQLKTRLPGSQPCLRNPDFELRLFQSRVHCVPALTPPPESGDSWTLAPGQVLEIAGVGRLEMKPAADGIALPDTGHWILALRSGGERCRPRGRNHSQSLKKLLQEYGVPPWWRSRMPLIFSGVELKAVGDLWLCDRSGETSPEEGWKLDWERQSLTLPH